MQYTDNCLTTSHNICYQLFTNHIIFHSSLRNKSSQLLLSRFSNKYKYIFRFQYARNLLHIQDILEVSVFSDHVTNWSSIKQLWDQIKIFAMPFREVQKESVIRNTSPIRILVIHHLKKQYMIHQIELLSHESIG